MDFNSLPVCPKSFDDLTALIGGTIAHGLHSLSPGPALSAEPLRFDGDATTEPVVVAVSVVRAVEMT